MVGVHEAFLDAFDHLAVGLPVLQVDGVAVLELIDLLLLVALLELLVVLRRLPRRGDEGPLPFLVQLQHVFVGGLQVEHLEALVLPQHHFLLLFELAQRSNYRLLRPPQRRRVQRHVGLALPHTINLLIALPASVITSLPA